MKGKGKGERSGGSSIKEEPKECPLQFPDLTPVDHTRLCLRYSAILTRDESDCVGIEEIDTLQTEFETLLASVAKRMRQLENEIQVLNNWQEGKLVVKESPATPKDKGKGGKGTSDSVKRSGKGEEKPSKKFKDSAGKGSLVKGVTKGKVQHPKVPDYDLTDSPAAKPAEVPKVLKTDAPNRFWAMVEPYCADINNDDLKVLEELMRSHEEDGDHYKVPPLGRHYSERWAQEDLLEEQRQGSCLESKRRSSADVSNMLKKDLDVDSSPFGPLTQRLVSALMEENIMSPLDDVASAALSDADGAAPAPDAAAISPRSLARQLNIGNTAALERRIKRELEENGILEAEEAVEESPDDEIVVELRKKQAELKALSQHNLQGLKRLYRLAKEEMTRQEVRRKVTAADNEVMELYRKIQAARAKKKSPSKKELEVAKKALKDREVLVKQLEAMTSPY